MVTSLCVKFLNLNDVTCLRFQGPRKYQLRYRVFDDKYDNATTIVITVSDVNDNPPQFTRDVYVVDDVTEEVEVDPNDLGVSILTVSLLHSVDV